MYKLKKDISKGLKQDGTSNFLFKKGDIVDGIVLKRNNIEGVESLPTVKGWESTQQDSFGVNFVFLPLSILEEVKNDSIGKSDSPNDVGNKNNIKKIITASSIILAVLTIGFIIKVNIKK